MRRILKVLLPLLALAAVGFFILQRVVDIVSPMPKNLGVANGRLALCPEVPNCVSSQADSADRLHYTRPVAYTGSAAAALEQIKQIISEMPRTTVVRQNENYLHAEFRSAFWGFIDDVEVYIDAEAGLIHFRSASRLGNVDLGVNRNRVRKIRGKFTE